MVDPTTLPVVRVDRKNPNTTTVAVVLGPLGWKRLKAQAEAWGIEPHEAAEMIVEMHLLRPRMRGRRR